MSISIGLIGLRVIGRSTARVGRVGRPMERRRPNGPVDRPFDAGLIPLCPGGFPFHRPNRPIRPIGPGAGDGLTGPPPAPLGARPNGPFEGEEGSTG